MVRAVRQRLLKEEAATSTEEEGITGGVSTDGIEAHARAMRAGRRA